MDRLKDSGFATVGVGKIPSIFDFRGFTRHSKPMTIANQRIGPLRRSDRRRKGSFLRNLVDSI